MRVKSCYAHCHFRFVKVHVSERKVHLVHKGGWGATYKKLNYLVYLKSDSFAALKIDRVGKWLLVTLLSMPPNKF